MCIFAVFDCAFAIMGRKILCLSVWLRLLSTVFPYILFFGTCAVLFGLIIIFALFNFTFSKRFFLPGLGHNVWLDFDRSC